MLWMDRGRSKESRGQSHLSEKGRHAKIMHVSTAHPVNDPRIFYRECLSLRAAGLDVELIALHDGEPVDHGIPIWPIEFQSSRFRRALCGSMQAFRYIRSRKPKILHLHDPELLPLGFIFKCLGKKVIFDAHEELPKDILQKNWIPHFLRRFIAGFSRLVLWCTGCVFDLVVAATPTIASDFPARKTIVVRNFPDVSMFSAVDLAAYKLRENEVVYLGLVEGSRGIREIFDAVERLNARRDVKLKIIGADELPDSLRGLADKSASSRVQFAGRIPYTEVNDALKTSRIGLLTLHPWPTYQTSLPLKLFEYMAAGLPVIASDFPYWKEMLEGVDCCVFVDPENPDEIAAAIATLLNDPGLAWKMGMTGRKAVEQRFNWLGEGGRLFKAYQMTISIERASKY